MTTSTQTRCSDKYLQRTFDPNEWYSPPLWSPYWRRHKYSLEKVQRRTTKTVPEVKELSYRERTTAVDLLTLEDRETRGDLITTLKFVKLFNSIRY